MFVSGYKVRRTRHADLRKQNPEALLVDRLVVDYVRGGKSPESYGPTFEGCIGFVRLNAASLKSSANLPFSINELVSAGSKGLADGLVRYQMVEGSLPSSYLGIKIRGAILDWIGSDNPIPKAAYARGARIVSLSDALALPNGSDLEAAVIIKQTMEWAVLHPLLNGKERTVLFLEAYAGLNQSEIGSALGLSKATICRTRSSAISKLQAALEGQGPP